MKSNQRCLVVGLRRALFGSCALLGVSAAAWGQAAPAQDDATTLDTIKVTAQSREQELKDVPIAINVLNGEMIDQVAATDIGDLDMFVPGLEVTDGSPTQPRYAIRGISTGDFGIGTDPAVGVYIDGVYSARTGGAMLAFNDIERIEVLKGPQGTLFGRNSAAGAVSIITNKPSNVAEGNARIRVGEDGRRYLSGLFNVPFGERHALRFSALSNHSDGWMTDAATGDRLNPEDTVALRAAWRSDLGESTTLNLSWDYENIDQLARPAIGLVALDPYPAPAPYPANPANYVNPLRAPVFNDVVNNEESRTFNGVTLQIDHAFPWGSLPRCATSRRSIGKTRTAPTASTFTSTPPTSRATAATTRNSSSPACRASSTGWPARAGSRRKPTRPARPTCSPTAWARRWATCRTSAA